MGSIRQLINSAGAVQQAYDYNSYGKLAAAPTVVNPFAYTGREYDTESGNYYYRARYYNPTLGRFLQRDPIGYYDNINLYAYVKNNSINFLDPDGLMGRIWIPRFRVGRTPNPRITRYGNPARKPPGWNENWQWRAASREKTDKSWWDDKGGEWSWHEDIRHTGHWDYNPWKHPSSEWQNIYPSMPPMSVPDKNSCPGQSDWRDECAGNPLCA